MTKMTEWEQEYFSNELWAVDLFGKTCYAKANGAEEGPGMVLANPHLALSCGVDWITSPSSPALPLPSSERRTAPLLFILDRG
jgi:hypothetical protein